MEIKRCISCGNIPEIKTEGDVVTIGCDDCGFSVSDSNTVNSAIEWWNRCNMNGKDLVIHGVDLLIDENETLRSIIKRGVDAANIDNPEEK